MELVPNRSIIPTDIIIFSKFHETLVGHNQSLCLPEGSASDSFDYEGEVAIVIGKQRFKIAPKDAPIKNA